MSQDNLNEETVLESKYYMLRSMITMAHADGNFCDAERAYMYSIMNHQRVPLTDEQYKTLEDDMNNPKPIQDLLPHINDRKYMEQLVYFARLMAAKDGDIDVNEEALLNVMHSYATHGLDLDNIRAHVKTVVAYDMNNHDLDLDSIRPNAGLFGVFDRIMLSVGYDLMRD